MQKTSEHLTIFVIVAIGLITIMVAVIITILYLYRKRQFEFQQNLVQTRLNHEKAILNTKIEIQEQTFQHISREIHDNINLSLTLAKLNLNTLEWDDRQKTNSKIDCSIELLSQSITQLSDLSKSLDADIINRHSLIKAVDEEIQRINRTGFLDIDYKVEGIPVYMNSQAELVIFRIIQEAFNNIIKHANTREVFLLLNYAQEKLQISIVDKGSGFNPELIPDGQHSGLKNMEARTKLLGGDMGIISKPGEGASLNFTIPFEIQ